MDPTHTITRSLLSLALAFGGLQLANPDDDFFGRIGGGNGADVGYTAQQAQSLAGVWPPGSSQDNPASWYEYSAVYHCPGNTQEEPRLEICMYAVTFCETWAPGSPGPFSFVWRREVSADPEIGTGGWDQIGQTCFTPYVPARSGDESALTEAMVVEAFHRTPFALPQAVLQPPDGVTLVNLPVYFQVDWPAEGFAPGDVDSVNLVGFEVRIRPTLESVTYHTGEGAAIGPTESLGGPYPTGDITHTYTSRATVNPYVTVEYGGEYSVNGGSWATIPGTATIDGPAVPLQVLESRNRLVTGPDD